MSHHQANQIKKKLIPFMTLLLAVACMGLLASCGGGGSATVSGGINTEGEIPFSNAALVSLNKNTSGAPLDGYIKNQFWVYSSKLSFSELKTKIESVGGLKIIAHRESTGFLVEAATENVTNEYLKNIKLQTTADDAFIRTYKDPSQTMPHYFTPNDGGDYTSSGNYWYLSKIGMPNTWDITSGEKSLNIGVMDAGYQDMIFNDFGDRIKFKGSKLSHPHGIWVISTIAGEPNNFGFTGLNWNSNLYLDDTSGSEEVMGKKYDDLITKGVKVINNSWGFSRCAMKNGVLENCLSPSDALVMSRPIRFLAKKHSSVLHIFAIGNAPVPGSLMNGALHIGDDAKNSPLDNLIVTAMSTKDNNLLSSSAYGATIDIAVPGPFVSADKNMTFGESSGAAAVLTGAASLVLSVNETLSAKEVKQILIASVSEYVTQRETTSGLEDLPKPIPILNVELAIAEAKKRLMQPTANISVITPKPTAGSETIFRADVTSTPNGAVNQWEWDFGDGTVKMQTGSEMFHTYTSGGTYTVKLKIKDVKGVTNTTTKEITVAGVAIVPTITDLTFTQATANTTAKLTAVFSTDMQSGYSTTGAYVPKAGKEGYWPDARTFVVEFDSYTSGGQITLVASGFKSVSGQPLAADRVYTFPQNQGLDGTFKVSAVSETGKLFAAPSTASSCTFTASGVWDSTSAYITGANGIGPITNVPLYDTWNWRLFSAPFMSLIASQGGVGNYVLIGNSATLNVASNKNFYFLANDGIGAHFDNGGELTVNYTCQ